MATLLLVTDSESHRIPFQPGPSLRDILDTTDFRVRSGCRGIGACGLCRIRVLAGEPGAPSAAEQALVHPAQLAEGVRLACQVRPHDDIRIEIINPASPSQWKSPPDGLFRPARARLAEDMKPAPADISHPTGLAVDLGTTHLCFSLYDLATGNVLANRWGRNPQQDFGADVVTRLAAASQSPVMAGEMKDRLLAAIGEALLDIAAREGVDQRHVARVTLVGNTGMLTLLGGRNSALLLQPAQWTRPIECAPLDSAAWLGRWDIHPHAEVTVVEPLAGFIGSDLLAGLVAIDFVSGAAPALFIDFGTNSETALWDGETLWVTASAGGPAFETGGSGAGTTAEAGAIIHVRCGTETDSFEFDILGDDHAKGLCGTGLVDLVACLRRQGRLSATGNFPDGASDYRFAAGGRHFTLTKRDVDQLQRAKAAVAGGIRALCRNAGIAVDELRRVSVAGAFGRHLDIGNAQAIGLLPPVAPGIVELCGNTALAGCGEILLSRSAESAAAQLRTSARVINLAHQAGFEEIFLTHLYLRPMEQD